MSQFVRPASDVANGGWTTAPLWSKLDDNNDADYVSGPGTGVAFLCTGNSVTDPLVSSGYTLRVRARRWGDGITEGQVAGVKLELLEGSTVRATLTRSLVSRSAFTTYEYALTTAEINAIGNHANLRLRVTEINVTDDFPSVAWAELEVPSPAVPAKVTGLNATDGTRAGDSKLTYNAVSGASSYDIYRHTSNSFGSATKIKSANAGLSYVDAGAGVGLANKRWYWVVAKNAAGDGPQSDPDTGYEMAVPSVPGSFAASDSTTEDGVDCTWAAATGDGAITYKLLRDGVVIYSGITGTSKRDTTGVKGTTYSYSVKSSNEAGASAASTANNGTRAVGSPPATTAPTGFSASDGAFAGRVRLSIDAYAGATEVLFYRAVIDSIPAHAFASGLDGSTTQYDDTTAVSGVLYYYWSRVRLSDGSLSDATASDLGSIATRPVRFFQEFLKAIVDALFKGTSAVTNLGASPSVIFEGLTGAYDFDPADVGYSTIPSGAKVGLSATYDGTDEDQLTADDGTLELVDREMVVAAGADPVELLLVYADWGARQPLVAIQDSFDGFPFEVLGADTPQIQWSRFLPGLFSMVPLAGAVAYPCAFEQALLALLGGSARHSLSSGAPTLKVAYMTSTAKLVRGVRSLDDIPQEWFCLGRDASVTLASVTTANVGSNAAKVSAANATFTAPAAWHPNATQALVYVHNADPRLALPLLLFPLPATVVFDGTDKTITWDTDFGIFQLGGGPASGTGATAGAVVTPAISGVPRLLSSYDFEADAAAELASSSSFPVLRADLSPLIDDNSGETEAVKLATGYAGPEYRGNTIAGWPRISRAGSPTGDDGSFVLGGGAGETEGELVVVNERSEEPDLRQDDDFGGRLESWVDDYVWEQRPIELSAVAVRDRDGVEEVVAGPVPVLKARTTGVLDLSPDGELTLGIVDLLAQLGRRVQTVRLKGTGGLEGGPELKGVRPRILLGSPRNVEGLLIATQPYPTYLLHRDSIGSLIQGVTAGYIGEQPINPANYTVDLTANTVMVTTAIAEGFKVTWDVVGAQETGSTLADFLRYVLVTIGPLGAADLDGQRLALLSAMAPFALGWVVESDDTFRGLLNDLTQPWANWGQGGNGLIGADVRVPPALAFPKYTYLREAVRSVRPLEEIRSRPACAVGYAKNWTQVGQEGVAAAALDSDRGKWAQQPHSRVTDTDEATFDQLYPADDPPRDYVTPLLEEADAQLVQRWVSAVAGVRKRPLEVVIDARGLRCEPNRVATVDWPLRGLDGGAPLAVEKADLEESNGALGVKLTAWNEVESTVVLVDDAGTFFITDDSGDAMRAA